MIQIPAIFDAASEDVVLTEDDFLFPEDWQDYEDERQGELAYAGEGGEDAYLDSYWESLYEM